MRRATLTLDQLRAFGAASPEMKELVERIESGEAGSANGASSPGGNAGGLGRTSVIGYVGLDRLLKAKVVSPQTLRAIRKRAKATFDDIVRQIKEEGLKGRQKRVRNWEIEEALGEKGK